MRKSKLLASLLLFAVTVASLPVEGKKSRYFEGREKGEEEDGCCPCQGRGRLRQKCENPGEDSVGGSRALP